MRLELDLGSLLMAKRKLDEDKRKALRADISARLAAGIHRRILVKELSLKYRISPISMRWYLRTQDPVGPSGSHPLPPASHEAPTEAITQALLGGDAAVGHDASLVDLLNGLTQEKIKRLMEAKKLIPKLLVFRRHESELRHQIERLEKKLGSEVGKARGLEAQIKRLAGL